MMAATVTPIEPTAVAATKMATVRGGMCTALMGTVMVGV